MNFCFSYSWVYYDDYFTVCDYLCFFQACALGERSLSMKELESVLRDIELFLKPRSNLSPDVDDVTGSV